MKNGAMQMPALSSFHKHWEEMSPPLTIHFKWVAVVAEAADREAGFRFQSGPPKEDLRRKAYCANMPSIWCILTLHGVNSTVRLQRIIFLNRTLLFISPLHKIAGT